MKNLISIAVLVLIALLMTSCVAIRGGANFGSFRDKDDYNPSEFEELTAKSQKALASSTSSETGFYIGAFLTDIPITDGLEFEPGINYVDIKDLNLIHAPILARYKISDEFSALAGPSFSYFFDQPEGLKSFGIGLNAGLSYDIVDNFLIEAKYDLGLSNLVDNGNSNNSLKLSQFLIGVAYRFNK